MVQGSQSIFEFEWRAEKRNSIQKSFFARAKKEIIEAHWKAQIYKDINLVKEHWTLGSDRLNSFHFNSDSVRELRALHRKEQIS
jgi:hypothetical protein